MVGYQISITILYSHLNCVTVGNNFAIIKDRKVCTKCMFCMYKNTSGTKQFKFYRTKEWLTKKKSI